MTRAQIAGWEKLVAQNPGVVIGIDEPDRSQPYSPYLQPCSYAGCLVLSHNYIYCPLHTRPED